LLEGHHSTVSPHDRPFNGLIRSCRTERNGEVFTTDFRRDGKAILSRQENARGTHSTTYEYSPTDALTRQLHENASGETSVWVYEYDPRSRHVRTITRAGAEPDYVTETFDYDDRGQKTKTLHVPFVFDGSMPIGIGVDGLDAGIGATSPLARMRMLDAADRQIISVDFAYDDEGRLVEEAMTKPATTWLPKELIEGATPEQLEAMSAMMGFGDKPSRRRHRYDALGRRIETLGAFFGAMGDARITMAYNDHRDEVLRITESVERAYSFGPMALTSRIRLKGTRRGPSFG